MPLYLKAHIMPMNGALARKGTIDAATRRFGIMSTWSAVGRSSECAGTCWDGLQWDPEFEGTFAEIRQSKTSKLKLIIYVAGADRFSCWYLALGDFLALHAPANWAEGDAWLIPELHKNKCPGTTIGDWIKALRPRERGGAE